MTTKLPTTVRAVKARITAIRKLANDDERAHGAEDALYADVLRAIATGVALDPAAMAREALTTETIGFERYCA